MQRSLSIKPISISLSAFIFIIFAALILWVPNIHAEKVKDNLCNGANLSLSGSSDCDPVEATNDINDTIRTVINVFTTVVGVVAVIFIIIGGFKFVTSGGDSGKVGSAKSTILYALIGLAVIALAQIIVQFVLKKST